MTFAACRTNHGQDGFPPLCRTRAGPFTFRTEASATPLCCDLLLGDALSTMSTCQTGVLFVAICTDALVSKTSGPTHHEGSCTDTSGFVVTGRSCRMLGCTIFHRNARKSRPAEGVKILTLGIQSACPSAAKCGVPGLFAVTRCPHCEHDCFVPVEWATEPSLPRRPLFTFTVRLQSINTMARPLELSVQVFHHEFVPALRVHVPPAFS